MRPVPIVALDVPDSAGALALVRALGESCRYYKVGSELFSAEGPPIMRALRESGNQVFLDLKFHDIPNTVAGAVRSAVALGASLLTVHASGGEAMIRAAVAAGGEACGVLAVTVLTSLDETGLATIWGREGGLSIESEVVRLARVANDGGAHGIVCSGHEAARIRREMGDDFATLIPGIRFGDGVAHDQARVMTPRRAAESGARYIVVGRAVASAPSPRAAMERVLEEIASASIS